MTEDGFKPVLDADQFLVFSAPLIGDAEIEEVVACLRSGWIGTGPRVARFEEAMRRYKGAQSAVALGQVKATRGDLSRSHCSVQAVSLYLHAGRCGHIRRETDVGIQRVRFSGRKGVAHRSGVGIQRTDGREGSRRRDRSCDRFRNQSDRLCQCLRSCGRSPSERDSLRDSPGKSAEGATR